MIGRRKQDENHLNGDLNQTGRGQANHQLNHG
jgi:hypothetical protein